MKSTFLSALFFCGIGTAALAQGDFAVQRVHFNPQMKPREILDVAVECAKDKICSTVINTAAAWAGIDPKLIDGAVFIGSRISHQSGSEETYQTLQFPSDYTYCKTRLSCGAVIPGSGDRASKFWLVTRRDEVTFAAWTPKKGFGGGRSLVDVTGDVVAVRADKLAKYKDVCSTPKENTVYECRGKNCSGGTY